jgi:tetratricopeptide (TPR) repeat protein
MLTARPPFQGASDWETLIQVVHELAAPPSNRAKGIPHDLDVITLKCLEKEPARRYASADALAEDLRRYLAGEPILARPVPALERAWKWARRHPAAAFAALVTAACAVLLVAMSVRYNNLLRDQANRADSDSLRARAYARAADANAQLADEERDLVIKAYDDLVGAVNHQLKRSVGTQKVREALLTKAISGLKAFVAGSENSTVERSRAVAHYKLGDLYHEIGSAKEAIHNYELARDMAAQLLADDPNDSEVVNCLREAYRGLGEEILSQHSPKEALPLTRKEVELAERFAALRPGTETARKVLIEGYGRLGRVLHSQHQTQEAREARLRVHHLAEAWSTEDSSNAVARESLADSHFKLADVLDPDEAYVHCDKAVAIYRDLTAKDPTDARNRTRLCDALTNLACIAFRKGEFDSALRLFMENEPNLFAALEADPDNFELQLQTVNGQFNVAVLLDQNERYSEAAVRFRAIVDRLMRLKQAGRLNDKPLFAEERLPDARECAELAEATPRAIEDLEFARSHTGRTGYRLLARRAAHYGEQKGGEAELRATICALLEQDTDNFDLLCSLACHVARCVDILDHAPASPESADLRARCVERSFRQLARSIDLGFSDPYRLEQDSDLAPIRGQPAFQTLMQRARDNAQTLTRAAASK